MGDLIQGARVTFHFKKAMLKVHPDKVSPIIECLNLHDGGPFGDTFYFVSLLVYGSDPCQQTYRTESL